MDYFPKHNGGTAVHPEGGTVTFTLPANTRSVYMTAGGGAGYYAVNGTAAGTSSMGFVPENASNMVFTADNIVTLSISAAAGVTVYTQFYTA